MSQMIWSMLWVTLPELIQDGVHRAPILRLRQLLPGITSTVQMWRRRSHERMPTVQAPLCIMRMTGSAGGGGGRIHIMEVSEVDEHYRKPPVQPFFASSRSSSRVTMDVNTVVPRVALAGSSYGRLL